MAELALGAGWVAAALFGGLWWGERGRRRTAENWKLYDAPDGPRATVTSTPDAEQRTYDEIRKRGVKRMTEFIVQEQPNLSKAAARKEAQRLVERAEGFGGKT